MTRTQDPSISLPCQSESVTFIHTIEDGPHRFQPKKEEERVRDGLLLSKSTTQKLNILLLFLFLWPKPGHMTILSCKEGREMYLEKNLITTEGGGGGGREGARRRGREQ